MNTLHTDERCGMASNNLREKWLPIGKTQRVRGLDAYREMAKRNGVRFVESDFCHGEILIIPGNEDAVLLTGIASAFIHDLFKLNDGRFTGQEFLHKYPHAALSEATVNA